jgi:hypothetical protein
VLPRPSVVALGIAVTVPMLGSVIFATDGRGLLRFAGSTGSDAAAAGAGAAYIGVGTTAVWRTGSGTALGRVKSVTTL